MINFSTIENLIKLGVKNTAYSYVSINDLEILLNNIFIIKDFYSKNKIFYNSLKRIKQNHNLVKIEIRKDEFSIGIERDYLLFLKFSLENQKIEKINLKYDKNKNKAIFDYDNKKAFIIKNENNNLEYDIDNYLNLIGEKKHFYPDKKTISKKETFYENSFFDYKIELYNPNGKIILIKVLKENFGEIIFNEKGVKYSEVTYDNQMVKGLNNFIECENFLKDNFTSLKDINVLIQLFDLNFN